MAVTVPIAGHECGCAGDAAADGGDVTQVGAVEALVDLFGSLVGVVLSRSFLTMDKARAVVAAQYVVEGRSV